MHPTIVLTIQIWTLIVAGFGFVIGQAFSDESNRRRSASQELRDDIRSRIPAVSKGLEKPAL